jgi:hypothetical protein
MTLTIWLLLITGIVLSQNPDNNYNKTDRKLRLDEITDPATLSRLLTISSISDKEKVKTIFRWITGNIGYRTSVIKTKRKNDSLRRYEEEEDTGALKPLNDRVAIKVLHDRETVCEGYARLFKSLCDHAGVLSAIITGYARTESGRAETKFRSNHSWNAVFIDDAWYLLDAAWASGYIAMPSGEFVRAYDDYYFLAAPDQFIRHHYPDDLRWSLLSHPPAINEFRNTPFRQRSFVKYPIVSFYPAKGIIEADVGDTIRLELETNIIDRSTSIAPDSLWDSASLLYTPLYAYIKPAVEAKGNKIYYKFPVNSGEVEWLHVMYNNDAVLRYKLNIRKTKDINMAEQ